MPNRPLWNNNVPRVEYEHHARDARLRLEHIERMPVKRGERFRYFGLLLLIPSNIAGSGRGRSQRKGWLNDRRLDAGQIGSSSASMWPTQRFGFRHSQT